MHWATRKDTRKEAANGYPTNRNFNHRALKMANTIDQAFIKQFETEVHMAYQRMGSKLRNTVRSTNVSGSSARFQKIGAGSASTKSRNGNVAAMELAHTYV